MAKVYVKKVNVVNATYFKKLNIDPAKLSLSQRSHTDRLITLVKPASNRYFKEGVWELVKNFVELTNGKDRTFISNAFRSVKIQIENGVEEKGDSHKEYKFDISTYSNCELLDKLVEIESKSRPVSEVESKEESEDLSNLREQILFNHWRFNSFEEHNNYVNSLDKESIKTELTHQDYCEEMAKAINERHDMTHHHNKLRACDIWKMEEENFDLESSWDVSKMLNLKVANKK